MLQNLLLLTLSVLTLTVVPTGDTLIKREKLTVERLPDLNIARASHCIFYAGSELTVVGGHTSGFVPTPTAEYYSGGAWHLMETVYPHDDGMMVSLDGGRKVLIAGGHEKNLGIGQTFEAEMYYPATHSFDGFSCLDRKRAFSQGVELDSNKVLIVGNQQDNDAFEIFDGQKTFRHLKDVSAWRSAPYVLPISGGDAIVFGSVWNGQSNLPCDTVDRMNGKPFRVPLLGVWMPFNFEQNCHACQSFTGKKATGEYTYLIGAFDVNGNVTIIQIVDTSFSLLPTANPLPISFGHDIITMNPSVVDTNSHRLYLVGYDTLSRVIVVAVEYDKRPAPVTIYISDHIPEYGNSSPLLTPDGDLVIVGGNVSDNFSPYSAVWLLKVGGNSQTAATMFLSKKRIFLIIGILIIIIAATLLLIRRKKHKDSIVCPDDQLSKPEQESTDTLEPEADTPSSEKDNELMTRIIQLMETKQLYLNPELKVSDLAEALGVHRNTVSACINSNQGCNFTQFVNEYRLRHAKQLLLKPNDMKMAAVGLESGFANERSFFRSFKTATGLTPREWQLQQGKNV